MDYLFCLIILINDFVNKYAQEQTITLANISAIKVIKENLLLKLLLFLS